MLHLLVTPEVSRVGIPERDDDEKQECERESQEKNKTKTSRIKRGSLLMANKRPTILSTAACDAAPCSNPSSNSWNKRRNNCDTNRAEIDNDGHQGNKPSVACGEQEENSHQREEFETHLPWLAYEVTQSQPT